MNHLLRNTAVCLAVAGLSAGFCICSASAFSHEPQSSVPSEKTASVFLKDVEEDQKEDWIDEQTDLNEALDQAELEITLEQTDASQEEDSKEQGEPETAEVSEPTEILDEQTEDTQNTEDAGYQHTVSVSSISPTFNYAYTYSFLQQLRQGSQKLYYSGSEQEASYSLGEVAYNYCDVPDVYFYSGTDANGTYLLLTDEDYSRMISGVATGDSHWNAYLNYVYTTCCSLNLNCSDAQLIEEINQYICDHFSYVDLETESMYTFVTTGQGKCIHYAELMADMCNACGIQAWTEHSDTHEWIRAVIDGTVYKFDPTYNDTSGTVTGYSWQ